ncbi:transporter family protein [Dyadobacter sp. BE34]|uniref:Transporter family protein n=1 Tax=Dyadobacter fermentans TaxID=94254 RepID=A0ABU1QXR6_9BACT|nr:MULTISPECIES: EamA family transporter [Dyadobacter]MDR6805953.1 transporter family protein [Dyadobacter fermentans]MDR7043693.1 transporter family protein [Dyadobacter sp. BE242]MDR7198005.1 transporter family protein [Dyadobacter sp. BE34]MDR7215967.1 transporter family protein [Dyadobacter sp. BE31]MDR7264507.1 transporter family protein [Dyadobacter sp. BE32]
MWRYYALFSAIFAALTAILAKVGIKGINENLATAIRTVVVLLMAWGIVFTYGDQKHLKDLSRNNILFLAASGVATGLSWIFYFKALETGPVSKVAPIDKLSVAIAIALSAMILGKRLDWKTAMGAALILAGTLVLVL